MKANELMIGDWVTGKKWIENPFKLTRINDNGKYYYGITSDDSQVGPFFLEEIEPMPLTPEILEKNGFIANKHVYPYPYYEYINEEDKLKVGFAFPQGNRTSYKEPWIYIDSENCFIEHLPCIFVHQLQHALRLCGIEKD